MLQLNSDESSQKATTYFETLSEQRADHRIDIDIYPSAAVIPDGAGEDKFSSIDVIITNKVQLDTDSSLKKRFVQIACDKHMSYRILAATDFWHDLPADLKIILEGAVKDTMVYITELHSSETLN